MNFNDLEIWKKNWLGNNDIVLWGYGSMCKIYLDGICRNYNVKYILDNDKSKDGTIDLKTGKKIVHPDSIDWKHEKIVITTYYEEVSKQLNKSGLKAYQDYCDARLFLSGIEWFEKKRVFISELHIAITTKCTLNCKSCNMFMPFYKEKCYNISYNDILKDFETLFKYVDKISKLVLLGGEPMLHKEFTQIIEFLFNTYSEKFDVLTIITNGTVLPKDELIDVCKRYKNIIISISDYNLNNSYSVKLNKVESCFEKNGIKVERYKNLEWKDFVFPYDKINLSNEEAYINMNKCNPMFRGYNDSKFYFCHIVWSANKAGLHKEQPHDYVDFSQVNENTREKVVMMNICCFDDKYISLCKDCAGCSYLNQRYIPVAEQV